MEREEREKEERRGERREEEGRGGETACQSKKGQNDTLFCKDNLSFQGKDPIA